MKLVTFQNKEGKARAGWLTDSDVVDMQQISNGALPDNMLAFIDNHEEYFSIIKEQHLEAAQPTHSLDEVKLLAPLPNPRSFRDFVGFEQHMLNAGKAFGHKVSEAWYEMPIFYFTNHHGIFGPDDDIKKPEKETKLDIELELACIIGKEGKDIKAEDEKPH
ncbi:MAG: fumarylacetoacetate hydrolase family protein [Bacteroidota bacterium]|nr:fumarylacetoacetate hydrolase family protein [Bacteroidota bacterium]